MTYAPIRGFREVIPVREGLLLVDRAHLNQFDEEEVNILLARVADRGYSIEFLNDGGQLEDATTGFRQLPGDTSRDCL